MAEHAVKSSGGAGLLERPLRCVVVTPELTLLDQDAEFIALPLYDGEIGIAPGHSPLIGRLGYGEMRLTAGGHITRYYVDGGFVQVVGNVVSVLTNRAVPATDINPAEAEARLATALARPATSEAALLERDQLQSQARAQLRVAQRN